MNNRIVILGAGHAGGTMAATLRQLGFEGSICLIGEEPLIPYQRPPLSKAWLKGEADGDSLALRPADFYTQQRIDLRTSLKAMEIDREARTVRLENGEKLSYDYLILATGARPIRLSLVGSDLAGIHVLRTAADAESLKADLGAGRRLAVIGGGYIGLEVAASAVKLGGKAVVIEREGRLLARSGSAIVADFFRHYHERQGVSVLLDATVTGFQGKDKSISGVTLLDGRVIPCDAALLGVGIVPEESLAAASGIECERGVIVDIDARSSDPAIFAIGDCARRPMPLYGRTFCPESVPNALEQVKQAASAIMGRPRPAPEVPWNWSDQYDLKLQIAGLPFDVDHVLVRGDVEAGKFAVFHLRDNQVQQVEAINCAPEFMVGKQLILKRTPVDPEKLSDSAVSMREVAA